MFSKHINVLKELQRESLLEHRFFIEGSSMGLICAARGGMGLG